jgi:ROK family
LPLDSSVALESPPVPKLPTGFGLERTSLVEGANVPRFGRGLASVVDILDSDVIVLGGGMSNVGELYEHLPAIFGRCAFSDSFGTSIRQYDHGASSGVRDAA